MPRVLYFAYGSNMDPSTLRGRRGIEWTRATRALAKGWRLAIDKPSMLGTGEAMATLVADAGSETWGVLFDIAADDFDHLALTEGVLIDHYQRTEIDVLPFEEHGFAGTTTAVTFTSENRDPCAKPTSRYLNLLLAGAAEFGLPDSWIEALRRFETGPESAAAIALAEARDAGMRKPGT